MSNEKLWPPGYLDWCLTYWTRGNPEEALGSDHFNSGFGTEVLAWMTREGLITEEGKPTERLGVFIEHLCSVPLPVCKWVCP